MERILEPEVMDDDLEAQEYDQMDFTEVNTDFALLASKLGKEQSKVLDVGTGTARIPLILADFCPQWHITAIDLASSMLKIAETNIQEKNKSSQISLQLVDGKKMPYPDNSFDLIISNSLIHHIPQPLELLKEINRVVKKNGVILIRDLFRPKSEDDIEKIVQKANLDYSPRQKQLFKDSLRAALTVDEIKDLAHEMEWYSAQVYHSSPRHWTLRHSLN
ncbi:class I SAM-dependent methyltransferase [Cyanobacterium sp. Dongsha4]|uniref:class I SAM-dependent methyltransferase n=1 Tax=Cyanobacterium sp. DS4 TaxID=2878255 RepID=UPI002E80BBED|nr:class I SAM-dependent methyltransferase [Cyanobacterium sp. Dongsha4]WVL02446.1 class I SAM-dependent methyltransferase [Cyanobacterium sp. Dongsha4]